MTSLQGTVVLITGAKGGLGAAVTRTFLSLGAAVAGVSRSIRAEDFAHPCFTAFSAELADAGAAQSVVEAVVNRFQRIDMLVHLVGGFAPGGVE